MTTIGFIGLGNMGLPMASNLLKGNHNVSGYDLSKSALERFQSQGGTISSSLKELAANNEVIISMLQTGDQVKSICLGENGLFSQAKPRTLFIDCSTIDVESTKAIYQKGTEYHHLIVDAPVSGGVNGAKEGRLTFMVGGEEEAYHLAYPILSLMG